MWNNLGQPHKSPSSLPYRDEAFADCVTGSYGCAPPPLGPGLPVGLLPPDEGLQGAVPRLEVKAPPDEDLEAVEAKLPDAIDLEVPLQAHVERGHLFPNRLKSLVAVSERFLE